MCKKEDAFCKHGYHINIRCMQCEGERQKPVDDDLDKILWGSLKSSAKLTAKGRLYSPKTITIKE